MRRGAAGRARTPRESPAAAWVVVAGAPARSVVTVGASGAGAPQRQPGVGPARPFWGCSSQACEVGSGRWWQVEAGNGGRAGSPASPPDNRCDVPTTGTCGARSTSSAVNHGPIPHPAQLEDCSAAPSPPPEIAAPTPPHDAEKQPAVVLVPAIGDHVGRATLPRPRRVTRWRTDPAATHVPGASRAVVHGGAATMARAWHERRSARPSKRRRRDPCRY